jgi:glutamate-1-semialdehyde 2,1-aminomutase
VLSKLNAVHIWERCTVCTRGPSPDKEMVMVQLENIIEEYRQKTSKSARLHSQSAELIQGGVASPFRFYEPHPFFVEKGEKGHIWDADGNEYIDFNNCYGAIIAGHAHPEINRAIQEQSEKGTMFGIPTAITAKLLRELLRRYPSMRFFRLTNTGNEATLYAIRLARAYTGKDKVIKIEGCYHGCHDAVLISDKPHRPAHMGPSWAPTPVIESAGILSDTAKNTLVVPWNDPDALEGCLNRNLGEVAGLIMEPIVANFGMCLPEKGYLEQVREITRRHNVTLIFDEVKVGVRLAPGGGTEITGVTPDIICLSKAMGGGMPLAAFGATQEFWDMLYPPGEMIHFGTYNGNPVSVAASLACLTKVMTDQAYDHMNKLGEKLGRGIEDSIKRHGIKAVVAGTGGMRTVFFQEQRPKNYRETLGMDRVKWHKWWLNLIVKGVYFSAPSPYEETFISAGNTEKDIDAALEKIDDSFKEL